MTGTRYRPAALRDALTAADARLCRVTARIPHGAVLDQDWPAPLDGILSGVARRRRLGAGYGTVTDHHVEPLPLLPSWAGYGRPDVGNRWVWAATCAIPEAPAGVDMRWFHQRWDEAAGERVVADGLPSSTATGRWKAWRVPLVVTLARRLVWWALGDPGRLLAACQLVEQVGGKRSQGEGVVDQWEVTDAGPADWQHVIWPGGGRIGRPFPGRAAASLGVAGAVLVPGSYRPPYWQPRWVTTPGAYAREWQPVIAPWTSRQEVAGAG